MQLKIKGKKMEIPDLPVFGIVVNELANNLLKTVAFPQKLVESINDKKREQVELVAMPTEKGKNDFTFYFFSALGHCEKSEVFQVLLEERQL